MQSQENGAWLSLYPSYKEIVEMQQRQDKLDFLLFIIDNIRWNFLARFFISYTFMSKYVNKVDDVPVSSDIRSESVISSLNASSPFYRDVQPIEMLLQWKDGYVIATNRFIGVTIWDAFAIVANTLLMLERAWLTWGRLSKKLVNTKAQMQLDKYEEGSAEYILIKSILDRSRNVLSAVWAFNKINKVTKRLERLENKRKLDRERDRKREEARKRKLLKLIALKSEST